MKVHSFHLMPYPYLPEDFREQYHSVWIDIPADLYDPELGHQVYNDYLDELEYAAPWASTASASTSTTPTPTACAIAQPDGRDAGAAHARAPG